MMMHPSTKMWTTTTRFRRSIATAAAMHRRTAVNSMRMSVGSSPQQQQHFSVDTPTTICHHQHQRCHCRYMSSNHSSMEPDWVRTAIQKMILDQAEHPGPNETTSTTTSSSSSSLSTDRTTSTTTTTTANGAMLDRPDLEKTLLSLQVRIVNIWFTLLMRNKDFILMQKCSFNSLKTKLLYIFIEPITRGGIVHPRLLRMRPRQQWKFHVTKRNWCRRS